MSWIPCCNVLGSIKITLVIYCLLLPTIYIRFYFSIWLILVGVVMSLRPEFLYGNACSSMRIQAHPSVHYSLVGVVIICCIKRG